MDDEKRTTGEQPARAAGSGPATETQGGYFARLAERTKVEFEWKIPRRTTFVGRLWRDTKRLGGLALFFLIATAVIYAGVILYYGLSVREYMEGLTATVSAAAIFVGGFWALAILIASLDSLFGNRACIRAEWIEIHIGTEQSKYHWARISHPRVVAADIDQDGIDAVSSETGRLEFSYKAQDGTIEDGFLLHIYGDVDLAALRRFAEERCAKD